MAHAVLMCCLDALSTSGVLLVVPSKWKLAICTAGSLPVDALNLSAVSSSIPHRIAAFSPGPQPMVPGFPDPLAFHTWHLWRRVKDTKLQGRPCAEVGFAPQTGEALLERTLSMIHVLLLPLPLSKLAGWPPVLPGVSGWDEPSPMSDLGCRGWANMACGCTLFFCLFGPSFHKQHPCPSA